MLGLVIKIRIFTIFLKVYLNIGGAILIKNMVRVENLYSLFKLKSNNLLDKANKSGPQMQVVKAMIDRIAPEESISCKRKSKKHKKQKKINKN